MRLLVLFAAGGPTDVVARILADLLSARWGGKPVVVETGWAGTIVMTTAVAKAAPDGHTLGVATNSLLINPAIGMKLPYDTFREIAGVTMIATQPVALVANKSFPASRLAETVGVARKAAEPLNYTSPGPRGVGHGGRTLAAARRTRMPHINYNGSAPALTDVIAGRVPPARHLAFGAALRRYRATEADRGRRAIPSWAPRTPDHREEFSGVQRRRLQRNHRPAGTPPPALDKLSADVRAVVTRRPSRSAPARLGINARGTTPKELDAWFAAETAKWAEIAKAANLKAESTEHPRRSTATCIPTVVDIRQLLPHLDEYWRELGGGARHRLARDLGRSAERPDDRAAGLARSER